MARFSNAEIEKRATQGAFVKRQLFVEPVAVSPKDVSLAGKTAIVTGGNTGLGFECCKQLIGLGVARLIIACRTPAKGEDAKKQLAASSKGKTQIEITKLDLASYDSIASFVDYTKTLDRLDIVINNAGVCKRGFELDVRTGHEETIQVNHLGNSLFIILLLPVLQSKNSPESPGRLTFVSSDTPAWAKFKEQNSDPIIPAFDKKETFEWSDRYGTSKLLGQLFLSELVKRVPSSVAIVNATNPGLCKSGLDREFRGSLAGHAARVMQAILARKATVGARGLTDAAVNHGVSSHGQYIEDNKVVPMAPFVYKAQGEKVAGRLWRETMDELSFAHVEEIVNSLSK
ncbi:NAD(P)-binding protein [Aspergillus californicus]